jgi:hypothetical protein
VAVVDKLPSRDSMMWIVLGVVGFLMFLRGFAFGEIDWEIFGLATIFASFSGALTGCIKSDFTSKRALEVVSAIVAFGIIICGYFITGSLLLMALTLFIAVLMFVCFMLSYAAPKIRSKFGKV